MVIKVLTNNQMKNTQNKCNCFMVPSKWKCPYYDLGSDRDTYCRQRFPKGVPDEGELK
jgi:hypothetical protein